MSDPRIDQPVRLTQDIPELGLRRGDVGVIRSRWTVPADAYEVELAGAKRDGPLRALLLQQQIEPE